MQMIQNQDQKSKNKNQSLSKFKSPITITIPISFLFLTFSHQPQTTNGNHKRKRRPKKLWLCSDVLDGNDDNLEEQILCKEACLDFQNSHVHVNTIDSETFSGNKDKELSISASKWPEHNESLALWVKWRGKWQAGIKCERADWPLATVKARPTHERKSYIVIFFPHKKNYSWADTTLVCAIDEFPQPIAHRSHKVGAQLVEDLTVARGFIMKMIVIGILNIVDQLPIQVLVETAHDLVVWREFAAEASRCKNYPHLGRLLLKLGNGGDCDLWNPLRMTDDGFCWLLDWKSIPSPPMKQGSKHAAPRPLQFGLRSMIVTKHFGIWLCSWSIHEDTRSC